MVYQTPGADPKLKHNRIKKHTLGGNIAVVAFSLAVGYLLAFLHGLKLMDTFLSTSPGGMAEMGVTAVPVHANVSLITGYQMFRLLFILFVVPPLLKRWLGCVARSKSHNTV